jgi:hypothetical protein
MAAVQIDETDFPSIFIYVERPQQLGIAVVSLSREAVEEPLL